MIKHFRHTALFFAFVFCVLGGFAQTSGRYSESEIKSAFICNFAKFTQWRAKPVEKVFLIAIIGDDNFNTAIEKIAKNVQIDGKNIVIQRFQDYKSAASAHIVYVGSLHPSVNLNNVLTYYASRNILTISERKDFCKMGGMINFSSQKVKYGFQINNTAAKKSGIEISAKLLKLATLVE